MSKTNAQRAADVLEQRKGAPRVERTDLGVEEHGGFVASGGTVVCCAIEHALANRAAQVSKGIHVRRVGDAIILSGSVPTWADWQAVEDAVREVHGIVTVRNQVRIGR